MRTRCVASLAVILVLAVVQGPAFASPSAEGTVVYPDDAAISYTEYVHATITHQYARFDRPGTFNAAWVTAPDTRVNFTSDALSISVSLNYREYACQATGCGHFWLEVDGALQQQSIGTDTQTGIFRYTLYQQGSVAQHAFSLIFPWGAEVDFRGLLLKGGTPGLIQPPPGRPAYQWAALGDSITQGTGSSGIIYTYPHVLSEIKGWRVINLGYGGEWVRPGDGRLAGDIPADVYTVALGINDYNLSLTLSGTRTRYEQLLDRFRRVQPTGELYCITPLWTGSEDNPNVQQAVPEDYRQVIRDLVTERMATDPHLHLIEGLDLVPNELSYFVDGLHPNDAGYALYASNLAALLPG
jgi:lysophospholipase L1-like esterase